MKLITEKKYCIYKSKDIILWYHCINASCARTSKRIKICAEKVQRRFMRMIPGLKKMIYNERVEDFEVVVFR